MFVYELFIFYFILCLSPQQLYPQKKTYVMNKNQNRHIVYLTQNVDLPRFFISPATPLPNIHYDVHLHICFAKNPIQHRLAYDTETPHVF